jgi:hypothetical protein
MTAIPKPGRPTNEPANLRPISVSSVWYRIVARVFVHRLNKFIPHIYSVDQHGFCPNHNTYSVITTIFSTVEYNITRRKPIFLCAVDVDKAYDSVDRNALYNILEYIRIGDCVLWQFLNNALI